MCMYVDEYIVYYSDEYSFLKINDEAFFWLIFHIVKSPLVAHTSMKKHHFLFLEK